MNLPWKDERRIMDPQDFHIEMDRRGSKIPGVLS